MKIVLIAAIARDGTIGDAGKVPWHIGEDLKRFKRITMGQPIIMGRRTFESIGKPLPGRRNIVLTRGIAIAGVECFSDLTQALNHLRALNTDTVFVIGGAEVYRAALPRADTMLLTYVNHHGGGDTRFPDYDASEWREISREEHGDFCFVEFCRRNPESRI